MKIYLDDDSANPALVRLLRNAGHDVVVPADVGTQGRKDARHFRVAIEDGRTILTHNHDDFDLLHQLVLVAGGHHLGVLVVRQDNDPKRDLSRRSIVRALRNLETAGVPIADELHVLNHWR